MIVRPATVGDFVSFLGAAPPWRCRAWAGEVGGSIVGMGGVSYPPHAVAPIVWADLTDAARRHAVTLHRHAMAFLRTLDHPRLLCMADSEIEAAPRWLRRLGFIPTGIVSDDGEAFIYDRHHHAHLHRDVA